MQNIYGCGAKRTRAALAALGLMVMAGTAAAQTNLDAWASDLLSRRALKTWTPLFYAGPATATQIGSVAGFALQVDPALPERHVIIRNKEDFKIHEGDPREETVPAGTEMSHQQW